MIWKAVDDDALMPRGRGAGRAARLRPHRRYALIKRALLAAAANTLDAQLDLERDLQRRPRRAPIIAEGVRAFVEKRAPRFAGGR